MVFVVDKEKLDYSVLLHSEEFQRNQLVDHLTITMILIKNNLQCILMNILHTISIIKSNISSKFRSRSIEISNHRSNIIKFHLIIE